MNQVIVFPRGQLSPEDKASMREMGIAVVEADDPSKVVALVPILPHQPADDLTMAAMFGLSGGSSITERARMVEELHRRMLAREKAKAAPGVEVDRG